MIKKTCFFAILVLLLGFTIFCGCVGDVAGSVPEKGDSGIGSIFKTPEKSPPVTPGEPSGVDTTVKTPEKLPPVTPGEPSEGDTTVKTPEKIPLVTPGEPSGDGNAEYALLRLGPNGNFRAYHEGWAYAMCDNGLDDRRSLYRMRPDGTEKQKVQNEEMGDSVYHDGWLYCATTNGIYRMRLDGSEKMQLYTSNGMSSVLIQDEIIQDEWIYFRSDYDLYRVKTNGSGLKKLADNCSSELLLKPVITERYIFFRSRDNKIIRCDLDGACKTVLIEGQNIVFKPVLADSGYLYYIVYYGVEEPRKGTELHRMKFDGTERQTIVQHSGYYWVLHNQNIFLKDGYIYYSHTVPQTSPYNDYRCTSYYRIRPDGTDHGLLCDKVRNHWLSEIIGSHIYYSGGGDFLGLYRLSINGGSPAPVYTYTQGSEYYTGYFVANNISYIVVR